MPGCLDWLAVVPRCVLQTHPLIPAQFPPIRGCFDARRGHKGRRGYVLPTMAHKATREAIACCLGALLTLGLPLTSTAEIALRAQDPAASNHLPGPAYAAFITEASHRFAIPERWICAVIQVESGWNVNAVSPRGALGLMQIMPKTWLELSVLYDLGVDPFDPKDNITAGTAYLRKMLERFGSKGAFAAYNAGPTRYERHLAAGRALPDETQAYIARLAPLIHNEPRGRGTSVATHSAERSQAILFVQRSADPAVDELFAFPERFVGSLRAVSKVNALALVPHATGLFMQRSGEVKVP